MAVLVAQLFPKHMVSEITGASQAGINFCFDFIKALKPQVIYAYQLNSESKELNVDFEDERIEYVCHRIFYHNGIFKVFNMILENCAIIYKIIKGKQNQIWFYNLTPQVLLIFFVLRILFRKQCFVIVADFTPNLIRNKIALRLLKKSNGIISLTPEMKNLINKNTTIVKSGIVDAFGEYSISERKKPVVNSFLFSGSLNKHTGILLALDTFAQIPEIELHISGTGECVDSILEYTKIYPNIKYLGYLSYSEYLSVLQNHDFVLSLRDTNMRKNKYNFPSKIIEYMVNEKIVLSSKRYDSLDDNIYFSCNYNEKSLNESIHKIIKLGDLELLKIKELARIYVEENFSIDSWGKTIKSLHSI